MRCRSVRRLLTSSPDIHHNGKLVLGESIGDLGGRQDRLPRLQEIAAGQAAPRRRRRLHARAAVLHRLGPVPRRRDPARTQRLMVQSDPHPDREISCDRSALQPAGISEGIGAARRDAAMVRPAANAAKSGKHSHREKVKAAVLPDPGSPEFPVEMPARKWGLRPLRWHNSTECTHAVTKVSCISTCHSLA